MTSISRLGEVVSPERDPGSLKNHKFLAWTRSCAQYAQIPHYLA